MGASTFEPDGCVAVVPYAEKDRWLQERRSSVGSSDAPMILGVSSFGGMVTVALSKRSPTVDKGDNELFRWGHALEPVILQEAQDRLFEEHGESASILEPSGWLYRRIGFEHLHATPDFLYLPGALDDRTKPGLGEIKNVTWKADEWREELPPAVRCQVQHGMFVMGLDYAVVYCLLRGSQLLRYEEDRDEEFIHGKLLPAIDDFWNRYHNDLPFPALGSENRVLAELYPLNDPAEIVELDEFEWLELDAELQRFKAIAKEAGAEAAKLEAKIKARMRNATIGRLNNGVAYSWKTQNHKAYSVAAKTVRVLRRSKGSGA